MRGILIRLSAVLACVVVVNCGNSTPTSPDAPAGGGPSGGSPSGSGPVGITAVASDNVFDDNEWETELQVFGAGGTAGASHVRYNGQEGADYRRVNIAVNSGGAQVALFSIKRGTAYFPASDGAVFSIDYSEDSILISGGGNGQYSAPALRQNGKLYTLVQGGGAFATPERTWTPHSVTGLKQNDFRTLASSSDHPDFSASGARIEVGFVRMNTTPAGSGGDTQVGGIDNWKLTLHR